MYKVLFILLIPFLLSGCADTHGTDKPGLGIYVTGALFVLLGLLIGWSLVRGRD